MKYKILSCLLAASTMLSLQACIVINLTSEVITLNEFGCQFDQLKILGSQFPIDLKSGYQMDSNPKDYSFLTVVVNQQEYLINNLNLDSMIIFEEDKDNNIQYKIIEKRNSL